MAQIIRIHQIEDPRLDVYARLTEAQLRSRRDPKSALFVAESAAVISCALDAGCEPVSLLMDERHINGPGRALIDRCGETPVYTAEDALLETLTGYRLTRSVLAAFRRPPEPSPESVCAGARRLAVLEDLTDTTNLGALFRSAAALGVDGVLLSPSCADPLCRRACRVSMGAVFQIPWCRLTGWPEAGLGFLRRNGFRTAALALREDSLPLDDPRLKAIPRLALLLGSEGPGLTQAAIEAADLTVRIPMSHGVNSLNVAAAAAVAFWELRVKTAG